MENVNNSIPRPAWIRTRFSGNKKFEYVRDILEKTGVKSVCVEAACPNRHECWGKSHVTFMILGSVCSRNCSFCNVSGGTPQSADESEPRNIAEIIKKLSTKYAVITSVTRDDLADKGAGHFTAAVNAIKAASPETVIELLIPDFNAETDFIGKIAFSGAHVIGHNIEMPRALYSRVRPRSSYDISLKTLGMLSSEKKMGAEISVKSSMILGLGESDDEIFETFMDLKTVGVEILYIGQYLGPSKAHWPVKKYYTPEEFENLRVRAEKLNFRKVVAGPLVRSSYNAHLAYQRH